MCTDHSLPSRLGAICAALLVTASVLGVGSATARPKRGVTGDPLLRVLDHKALRRATVGIEIRDLASGQVLFQRGAARKLNPASAAKLITTAAALKQFGPSHRFITTFHGRLSANGLLRELTIKGGGNPATRVRDLWAVVEQLRRLGVTRVHGGLVLDLSLFDAQTLPPAYQQKPVDAHYRPSISAFSVNFSRVAVFIKPGAVGQAPQVQTFPRCHYLQIDNQARTVAGKKTTLRLQSVKRGNHTALVLTGELSSRRHLVLVRKRIWHPSRFAASVLRQLLSDARIRVDGGLRFAATPAKLPILVRLRSAPLSQLIAETNKTSNNFMAELLFKALGGSPNAPASFSAATTAVKTFLEQQVKLPDPAMRITNGSGLYDANRVSAAQLSALLRYMSQQPSIAPEYQASLAIAGVDGTLHYRLRGETRHRLRAKTGTLDGVSALVGYLRTKSGRAVSFVFLINGPVRPYRHYRQVQDALARAAYQRF